MFMSVRRSLSTIGWLRYWLFDRNYNVTIRAILIGACFAFSALTAIFGRDIDLTSFGSIVKTLLPIMLMGGMVVSIFMYRSGQTTALAILVLSTLVHDGISTGTGTKLTFTFLVLILWSLVWLFKRTVVERNFNIHPALPNWPIFFFSIVVIIAYLWSGAFVEEKASFVFAQKSLVRLMTATVLIVSPLTLVLFANAIRTNTGFKIFAWWFVVLGLIMGVVRLVLGTVPEPMNDRGQFPTWFTAIAFGQILFNKDLRWYIKLLLLAGIGLWAQITLGLGLTWLSGWLPIVLVLAILIAVYSRKVFVFALICVVIWGIANIDFIKKQVGGESTESGSTRSTAWGRAFGVVGKHFLFGAGPAGYEYYFEAYGYYNGAVGTADLSHNNYIDILAQTGVVGFTLWVLLWGGQGLMVWKLYRKRIDDPFLSALKYSLVACFPAILVAMMLGDWVTPFPYTQTLFGFDYTIWAWMVSGISIALYHYTPNTQLSDLASRSADTAI